MSVTDTLAVVSHEQDGRILSGVGVTADSLAETMDRHTPDEATSEPVVSAVPGIIAPEPKGRARYTKLATERDTERTRAEAAERERDELRAKLAQPTPAIQPQPITSQSTIQQPPARPQGRKQPTEDEIGTAYQNYGEFVADTARWVHEQAVQGLDLDGRVRQGIEADRAARSFNDRVDETHTKARGIYADFDQVRANGPGAMVPMADDRLHAIIAHPASEHIQYAIMKDGALAQRLASIDPISFGLELSKLAPNGTGVSPASPVATASTNAPAPYQPVGTGSKTTAVPSSQLAGKGYDFDASGYREKRAAERKLRNIR